jgi:hypothetical protein
LILNNYMQYYFLQDGNMQADYFPDRRAQWDMDMRFTHGMTDGGQKYPLSQKKSNSSSLCDHWARFGLRTALAAEAGSLSFVGAAFLQSVETCCSWGTVATYVLGGLPHP